MDERRILFFILSVIAYSLYCIQVWFIKEFGDANAVQVKRVDKNIPAADVSDPTIDKITRDLNANAIPICMQDSCSPFQVFTDKPAPARRYKHKINLPKKPKKMDTSNNALTMFGIAVFLVILTANAVLDAIKVKEEMRVRGQLNPTGERRQSLAEFANKKTLRRESSKIGQQLFQISESAPNQEEEQQAPPRRQTKAYTRGDSTNSYLSEATRKTHGEGSAPASISEAASAEPRLVKRQSVAKLIGGRPAPMVRRSSFPALPQNPEVQALMLGHRQQSVDSDDEDGRGRRVRIIRRY